MVGFHKSVQRLVMLPDFGMCIVSCHVLGFWILRFRFVALGLQRARGAPNLTPQSQSETSMLLRPSVAGGLCSFKGGCGEAVLAGLGVFLCS